MYFFPFFFVKLLPSRSCFRITQIIEMLFLTKFITQV